MEMHHALFLKDNFIIFKLPRIKITVSNSFVEHDHRQKSCDFLLRNVKMLEMTLTPISIKQNGRTMILIIPRSQVQRNDKRAINTLNCQFSIGMKTTRQKHTNTSHYFVFMLLHIFYGGTKKCKAFTNRT